jgi:hypothetical protein
MPKPKKSSTFKRPACDAGTAKLTRASKRAKITNTKIPPTLTSMPLELQYMIYEQVFLDVQPQKSKLAEEGDDDTKAEPVKNPTALLLVSRAVSVEATRAFHDTWVRSVSHVASEIKPNTVLTQHKIDLVKSATQQAIKRNVVNARKTRSTAAEDARIRSILQFRHININAQLEFDEDIIALNDIDILLFRPGKRIHHVNYEISLGYLDSHCCSHVLGLIFKHKPLYIMAMVTGLAQLHRKGATRSSSSSTVALNYTRGCHCANLERKTALAAALAQMEKSCKQHGFKVEVIHSLPRTMPRWTVEDAANGIHISRANVEDF